MKLRFLQLYDTLSDSFWFLPAVMAFIAVIAAFASVDIDRSLGNGWVHNINWVWSGGPDGARAVLSTMAGSLMTVISIVFSLTITTLAQQSSHYGPRILRNFTSDSGVQFTLGIFIATFVYCLLVLRTVQSIDEQLFVPYLSVNIGVGLALASLAVLIYFIHHVSQMIQVENVIAEIGQDFQQMLGTFFPKTNDQKRNGNYSIMTAQWQDAILIESKRSGFLQQVDFGDLTYLAARYNLKIKVEYRPGDFIAVGVPILRAMPAQRITDDVESSLRECLSLGRHHIPLQDPLFLLQQLVEIAAHALSPAVNEPFTAQGCIAWLGAALRGIAKHDLPPAFRYDKNGEWRVLCDPLDFNELVHAAFDQIRIYGANNPPVMISLINAIANLDADLHRPNDRTVMMQYLQLIKSGFPQIANAEDRNRVAEKLQMAQRALSDPGVQYMEKSEYE